MKGDVKTIALVVVGGVLTHYVITKFLTRAGA